MKKRPRGVILQFLSVALGSALVCVPVSQILFGEGIPSTAFGILLSFYLMARVNATLTEGDRNGGRNVFAAVFITVLLIFSLLILYNADKTPSQVEGAGEPTESDVIHTAAPETGKPSESPEEKSGAPVEMSSPLVPSSHESSLSSLPLGEKGGAETSTAEEKRSVPDAPAFSSGPQESISLPSSPVISEEKCTLVPSSPSLFSSTFLVPDAPLMSSGTPERGLVPSSPVFEGISAAAVPGPPVFASPESVPVPEVPVFSPVVQALEGEAAAAEEESGDDPWADFFFSDEEMALEDGIYYFTLFVNDNAEGEAEVLIENGEVSISALDLSAYIYPFLEEEKAGMIFSSAEDYYSVDYLESMGIEAWADTAFFEYYVTVRSADMPLTKISVRGTGTKVVVRPITGAVTVNPVSRYLISSYSLQASTTGKTGRSFIDNFRFSMTSNNSFRIRNLRGSYNWSLSGKIGDIAFGWGSYSFYRDFREKSIRVRFGNVSPDTLSPSGTPIGIRFDKSSQYGDSSGVTDEKNQKMLVLDRDSEVVVYNQDREVFRRKLAAGRYLLHDFVLYSGTNDIRVVVSPLDGSASYEETFTITYATSLLEVGELYYGAAYAFSRSVVDSSLERESVQVDLPFFNSRNLRYDLSDFAVSGYVNAGLSDSLTGVFQAAVKGRQNDFTYRLLTELTNLNRLGTLKMNGSFSHSSVSSLTLRLSQVFLLRETSFVRGLSASVGYSKADFGVSGNDIFTPMISLSGSYGIAGWSLSASSTLLPSDIANISWAVVPSLTFSLGPVNLSFSSTLSGVGKEVHVTYSGRLTASFRIRGISSTVTTNGKDTSLSSSYSGDGYGISGRVRTTEILKPSSYNYSLDFSSSSSLFSYSASASTTGTFESINLGAGMSFASVLSEGLMSVSSTIPESFMMIRQRGALRGNTISVATSGSSASTVPKGYLGAPLFKGLSSSGAANLSIYSESSTGFSTAQVFDIFIPDTENRGYIVTIEGEESYTVSGTAEVGGKKWINGSSPLRVVETDETGFVTLHETDEYVFSDRNGLYIISDLKKGTYGFDVNIDNRWYLFVVSITDKNSADHITMLKEKDNTTLRAPEIYSGVIETTADRAVNSDTFWNELYGEAL